MSPLSSRPRRPLGIAVLCLFYALLAIGAFGNAAALLQYHAAARPRWLAGLEILYGGAAYAVCVGLWRMQRWSLTAQRAWMLSCAILMVSLIAILPQRALLGGYPGIGTLILFIGFGFFMLDRYVRAQLSPPRDRLETG